MVAIYVHLVIILCVLPFFFTGYHVQGSAFLFPLSIMKILRWRETKLTSCK